MKKVFSVVLVLTMVMGLCPTGCGKKAEEKKLTIWVNGMSMGAIK